jgi:spoIIIJ-associated protein
MNTKRPTLEVIAPTIDEAIEKGLSDLGLPKQAVEIEILDEGTKGLFGLGTRQARIRITVIEDETVQEQEIPDAIPPKEEISETIPEIDEKLTEETPEIIETSPPEDDLKLSIAREIVSELLENMGIYADVTSRYGEPDEMRKRVPILVDIHGDDLSILIGKRAETLNAFQFIARLIMSKELGHAVILVVDVEGYRSRREKQVRQLANRMADQALRTGRREILEPMPANERRFVHIELRENPQVTTESVGEEPYRKVTIIPTN